MNILLSGKSSQQTAHGYHHHSTWEIISNLEGEGYLEFGNQIHAFDDSTIVCIPPNVEHAKFAPEGFCDIWIWCSTFPSLDRTKPTILNDDGDRNITKLIQILYSIQYRKTANKEAVAESLLDSIQQLILSRLERAKKDPRVEEIINQIVHHFQDASFSLDDILSHNGYCSDHMRRLFHEQVGKTPHHYLSDLRIKTAKKLLASREISNYTVKEISTMVGFNDVGYFSRVFKAATGQSPGQYVGDHVKGE
ncbi:MAG: helix-turn-helix transcriptional regulator [Clostridia bacterium]|nr:helix-turn-helix transcriptional regulator [Clostridia bacterium]